VYEAIWKTRLEKLSKIILLHDSAHSHMATRGCEIMNHPHYSPDFALSGEAAYRRREILN
jgi:hypothetical protein